MGAGELSQSLLATARSLAADRVSAEVVAALEASGIPAILLKGPTLASWLYDDGSVRYYLDSDILVRPDRFQAAEAVLRELGFAPRELVVPPPKGELPHAEPWHRRVDSAEVDLHRTLSGLGVAPETAWEVLVHEIEPMDVGGATLQVLRAPGRALLVVLHAAQHGPEKLKPLEDLRRAIERGPLVLWEAATELAVRLDAVGGLASGLRLLPAGAELAARLDLASDELVGSATKHGSAARLALGLDRLGRERGFRARLRLLRREFFPSPAFLRWWSPLARRGRAGLVAAYVWRPVWLLWHALPSLVLVWRTRRAAGQQADSC